MTEALMEILALRDHRLEMAEVEVDPHHHLDPAEMAVENHQRSLFLLVMVAATILTHLTTQNGKHTHSAHVSGISFTTYGE